jgi:chorismate mutase/prephenate dehydratase
MTLENLRKKINHLDERIVTSLNERARISTAIGKEKVKQNKSIYSPEREKEVLSRVKKLSHGPMTADGLEAIYREIMSNSLSLEKSLGIAYLGPEGSYSYIAAFNQFGSQVQYVSCNTLMEVFQKVEHDDCDYGVVPIENSVEGAVTHTFDLLVDSDLKICRQRLLKISHCLLSKTRDLKKIKVIYSVPTVFGQCRNWLFQNMPNAQQVFIDSTTQSAKMAASRKNSAAIASSMASKLYKLPILKTNIQDIAHNTTRFLVISKQDVPPTGCDRTSVLFSIRDKVGALHAMLTPFLRNGINLTKIESRPSKKKAWDYYFFVDFEGHREDKKVKKALKQLEGMCKYLKILGSYPIVE